jgi:hypothetical protein
MPKPSELDLDILALDPRSSDAKIHVFFEFQIKNEVVKIFVISSVF